jgi:hypothetical protein
VYDRLQPAGICLSYQQSLDVVDKLGSTFNHRLVDALVAKKKVRLVGDNVDYCVKIHKQHMSDDGKLNHMHHAFASAILINDFDFSNLNMSTVKPQKPWRQMTVQDFLLNPTDVVETKKSYVHIICQVAAKFIPTLQFFTDVVPDHITGPHTHMLPKLTEVIRWKRYRSTSNIMKMRTTYYTIMRQSWPTHSTMQDCKLVMTPKSILVVTSSRENDSLVPRT